MQMSVFKGLIAVVIAGIAAGTCLTGCERRASELHDGVLSGDLVIFHAGSLAVPFKQLADEFMRLNPEVRVLREVAGSRECARKVTDLGKYCDVLASADGKVIANLLMPKYATWYIEFANNEMVAVYDKKTLGEWKILLPAQLLRCRALYRADPDLDPCGYRTLMVWQLMERYYGQPGLYEKLLAKSPANKTRPKETDILALFEIGQADCFFIYRSVAEQQGLNYVTLPDEVNLSQPGQAQNYAQVQVEVSGGKPGTTITRVGAPIVYGITIPTAAEDSAAAQAFVRFVLSAKGKEIMRANGQGVLNNVVPADSEKAKALLEEYVQVPQKT